MKTYIDLRFRNVSLCTSSTERKRIAQRLQSSILDINQTPKAIITFENIGMQKKNENVFPTIFGSFSMTPHWKVHQPRFPPRKTLSVMLMFIWVCWQASHTQTHILCAAQKTLPFYSLLSCIKLGSIASLRLFFNYLLISDAFSTHASVSSIMSWAPCVHSTSGHEVWECSHY